MIGAHDSDVEGVDVHNLFRQSRRVHKMLSQYEERFGFMMLMATSISTG